MIQKKYIAIVGLALTVAFSSACVGNQPPENDPTEYQSASDDHIASYSTRVSEFSSTRLPSVEDNRAFSEPADHSDKTDELFGVSSALFMNTSS